VTFAGCRFLAKKNYYILSHGKLKRKKNTIYFYKLDEDGSIKKKILPVKKIHTLYILSRVSISSSVISYLSKHRVPIHFFNKYGIYIASIYPRKYLLSGHLLVNQAKHYLTPSLRMEIAKEIIYASISNMLRNLKKHDYKESINLTEEITRIIKFRDMIQRANNVEELRGIEGNARQIYYQSFNKILKGDFKYAKRTKRPPETKLDALISFGNSLLYASILNEIYHTQLDPTISYLHEPSERRYSLSLDISEIFKPIIVDRVIFKLVNKKMLNENDFIKDINYTILSYNGKNKFLREYEEKLKTTIKHPNLRRKVSIQRLIRLECYKLMKHILGLKKYRGLVAWW